MALDDLRIGQILKIIVDYDQAVSEVPSAMEFDGHKILEVKRFSQTDWEIIIQKNEDAIIYSG